MAFKPSKEAEEFIELVHSRVGAANKAVLGRSAVCLALAEGVPDSFKPPVAQGKDLSTDALFGELEPVINTALNFRAGKTLTETQRTQEFRRAFEWGCQVMRRIWEDEVGRDQGKFIAELLRRSKASSAAVTSTLHRQATSPAAVPPRAVVETEVKLKLLTDAEPWSVNGPGTSNGLLVISGAPGFGKSQLALDLLAQLSGQGVRFVFFDLKGELEDGSKDVRQQENRTKFLAQTGASYVRLIRDELPINPLWRDGNDAINAQSAYEIASLFGAFVPQLGAVQVGQLNDSFQSMSQPDFTNWLVELEALGGTGVHRETLKRICDVNLFASATTAMPLEQWLSQSLVIDFKQFGNDEGTKSLAVALILNLLMKRLNTQLSPKKGVQPLKMVLFVDEAHLLLPKEGKIGLLGSLARQGRSWGFPVWLASQDADAFETRGDKAVDFAELAECGIHLTPQTLSATAQKRILGGHLTRDLQKGDAVVKLAGKMKVGKARQYHRDGGNSMKSAGNYLRGLGVMLFIAVANAQVQPAPKNNSDANVQPSLGTEPARTPAIQTPAAAPTQSATAPQAQNLGSVAAQPSNTQSGSQPSSLTTTTAGVPSSAFVSAPSTLPVIAAPADIASLTAKEILAANNQVVSQVATMYQHLGLFITIIVTLVGGVATWMGYIARKNVHEFVAEWTKKLETIKVDMDKTQERLSAAVELAERSAAGAGRDAQSINDSAKILTQTIKDVDVLRSRVASLAGDIQHQSASTSSVSPAAPTTASSEARKTETLLASEAEQLSALLRGKVDVDDKGAPKQ